MKLTMKVLLVAFFYTINIIGMDVLEKKPLESAISEIYENDQLKIEKISNNLITFLSRMFTNNKFQCYFKENFTSSECKHNNYSNTCELFNNIFVDEYLLSKLLISKYFVKKQEMPIALNKYLIDIIYLILDNDNIKKIINDETLLNKVLCDAISSYKVKKEKILSNETTSFILSYQIKSLQFIFQNKDLIKKNIKKLDMLNLFNYMTLLIGAYENSINNSINKFSEIIRYIKENEGIFKKHFSDVFNMGRAFFEIPVFCNFAEYYKNLLPSKYPRDYLSLYQLIPVILQKKREVEKYMFIIEQTQQLDMHKNYNRMRINLI